MLTDDQKAKARVWYGAHREHVNKMLSKHGPQIEPTGSDANRPELWKDIHWRYFAVTEVWHQMFAGKD